MHVGWIGKASSDTELLEAAKYYGGALQNSPLNIGSPTPFSMICSKVHVLVLFYSHFTRLTFGLVHLSYVQLIYLGI